MERGVGPWVTNHLQPKLRNSLVKPFSHLGPCHSKATKKPNTNSCSKWLLILCNKQNNFKLLPHWYCQNHAGNRLREWITGNIWPEEGNQNLQEKLTLFLPELRGNSHRLNHGQTKPVSCSGGAATCMRRGPAERVKQTSRVNRLFRWERKTNYSSLIVPCFIAIHQSLVNIKGYQHKILVRSLVTFLLSHFKYFCAKESTSLFGSRESLKFSKTLRA